jgi:hypothetical protein
LLASLRTLRSLVLFDLLLIVFAVRVDDHDSDFSRPHDDLSIGSGGTGEILPPDVFEFLNLKKPLTGNDEQG